MYLVTFFGLYLQGWVEIKNSNEYGFNLWLVQTDGIYGDWYILRNRNDGIYFTNREPMKEPFAFTVDTLVEAIKGVEAMSLYTSSVEPYTEESFLGYIAELIQR